MTKGPIEESIENVIAVILIGAAFMGAYVLRLGRTRMVCAVAEPHLAVWCWRGLESLPE